MRATHANSKTQERVDPAPAPAPDHAALVAAVASAVETGDVGGLRKSIFEAKPCLDDARERWVLKPGAAPALTQGFKTVGTGSWPWPAISFAELCFRHGRAGMFREVLDCIRPASVPGHSTSTADTWFQGLCRCRAGKGYVHHMLLQVVANSAVKPHSREFILLALELYPESSRFVVKPKDPAGAALFTECEMAMRVRQVHGGRVNQAPAVADQKPAVRRARTRSL